MSTSSSISSTHATISHPNDQVNEMTNTITYLSVRTTDIDEKISTSAQPVFNQVRELDEHKQAVMSITSSGLISSSTSQAVSQTSIQDNSQGASLTFKDSIVAKLQSLPDEELVFSLENYDPKILQEALKGRYNSVASEAIRSSVEHVRKSYENQREYLIEHSALSDNFEPGPDFVQKNFQLWGYIRPLSGFITHVDLSSLDLFDTSVLEHLALFLPNVTSLDLSNIHPTDQVNFDSNLGRAIGKFPLLTTLILKHNEHLKEDFFQALPRSIEVLICTRAQFSDSMHRLFEFLPRLKELDISYTNISSAFLLNKAPALRKLKMSPIQGDDHNLTVCFQNHNMPILDELDVSADPRERNFPMPGDFLEYLPLTLSKLNCQRRSISDANLAKGLAVALQLESLDISHTDISTPQLQKIPQTLVKLACCRCRIDDDTLIQIFFNNPKLKEVDIATNAITGACLKYVPRSVRKLDCAHCSLLTDTNLKEGLNRMEKLSELNISDTNITGESLQFAAQTLLKFDCSRCQNLTDTHFATGLKATTQLTELNISETKITGESLKYAPQSLLKLDCSQCSKLADDHLSPFLSGAKKLKMLDISKTMLTGSFFTFDMPALLKFNCSSCSKFYYDTIPAALSHMPKLIEVDISYNRDTFGLDGQVIVKFPKSLKKIVCNDYSQERLEETKKYVQEHWPIRDARGLLTLSIVGEAGEDTPINFDEEEDNDD